MVVPPSLLGGSYQSAATGVPNHNLSVFRFPRVRGLSTQVFSHEFAFISPHLNRYSPIPPSAVGHRFDVHTGKLNRSVKITPLMVGYRFGSLMETRKLFRRPNGEKDRQLRRRLSRSLNRKG